MPDLYSIWYKEIAAFQHRVREGVNETRELTRRDERGALADTCRLTARLLNHMAETLELEKPNATK